MRYSAYIFDFDYTLVDSSVGIVGCFQRTMRSMGQPIPDADDIKRTIGMPMPDAVGKLINTTDKALIEDFIRRYQPFADKYMTDGTTFFPHTVETLTELKRRGAKVAIVSSKTSWRIMEKWEREGCASLIDYVVGAHEVEHLKPAPDGMMMALKALGAEKSDTLYCGDSTIDAETALNAGLDFAGVTTGTTPADVLARYPHVKIMSDIKEILDI